MAWKNLKQRSLADSMVVPHEAVKELDELNKSMPRREVRKRGRHC